MPFTYFRIPWQLIAHPARGSLSNQRRAKSEAIIFRTPGGKLTASCRQQTEENGMCFLESAAVLLPMLIWIKLFNPGFITAILTRICLTPATPARELLSLVKAVFRRGQGLRVNRRPCLAWKKTEKCIILKLCISSLKIAFRPWGCPCYTGYAKRKTLGNNMTSVPVNHGFS